MNNSINNYWLLGECKKGISIITAVKNRNENLIKTVPSWLKVKGVDEIIIIDWCSDTPVAPLFEDVNDERLKIIRLEGYSGWRTCRAFNFAVRCASYDKIMRLDSDYLVEPDIVNAHPLNESHFYTGYWGNARNLNEIFTNGFVYFYKWDFIKVNGYNESFQMYGYDDDDFYNRMEAIPLKKLTVHNNFVYHIPHSISLRSNEFEITNQTLQIDKSAQTDLTIRTNDYLSKVILPWGEYEKIPVYTLSKKSDGYYVAEMSNYIDEYFSEQDIRDGQIYGKAVLLSRDSGIPIETFQDSLTEEELDGLYLIWNSTYKIKNTGKKGFNLLISLYNESDLTRCYELLRCISQNIINQNIVEVTVFYDSDKDGATPQFIQTFLYKHRITHHYVSGKPTFANIFAYANREELGKCIIANSDILYDDTLSKLVDIDLKDKLLCLSRKNLNPKTGDFELITWENGTPQYFSSDSWIFETPFDYEVRDDVQLGTMHSEPFLANQLYRQRGLDIYNPCLDVNSFHIQRGISEMQRMNTDKDGIKERDALYANEYQRLCSSDPISGVVWCTSKDLNNSRHTQYRATKNYIFVHIDHSITESEINIILKYGELCDRNIWVFDPSQNEKTRNIISRKNNNINITDNSNFKDSVSEFNGDAKLDQWLPKNAKDVWIKSSIFFQSINQSEFKHLELPKISKPKISIVTPSYNAVKYIEEAILSVLDQGYDNFEHIIMDGGSDDGTVDILKKYDHLIWVSEEDSGQSEAMNKGFARSTGEIIGYLNADDYYLPGAFETIVPYFEDGTHFLTGKVVMKEGDDSFWINNPSNSHARWLIHWAEQAFPYNPVGYFYRREVQSHVGGYVDDNHYSMDFEFLLEVAQDFSIHRSQKELGVFRFVKGNKSTFIMDQSDFWSDNKFGYVKNYLDNFPDTFQKDYLKRRDYYYKIFSDQSLKIKTLTNTQALQEAPEYLITMKIQRNIVLEHNSINVPDKEVDHVCLCLLSRYDEIYLDEYLKYYSNFGIKYFYLFGQGDRNEKIIKCIKDYDNIKYYSVDLDTNLLRYHIINYILRKYLNEKWIVFANSNQFIHLPMSDHLKSFQSLISILEENNFTGVVSNNIEMLPKVGYDPMSEDIMNYRKDYNATTLQFTHGNSEVLNNFYDNTVSNHKIKRHKNDAITGLINKDRDITRVPVFKNTNVKFVHTYIPTKLSLADFNLYTKVYSLVKYIYLDQIEEDLKYYMVFDLNYNLEEKLGGAFNVFETYARITEKDLEKKLLEKDLLVYSPKLLNYSVENLFLSENGVHEATGSMDEVKDLLTQIIALNSVTKEIPVYISTENHHHHTTNMPASHEEKRLLDKVYNSYSWKIGNGIMKVVDKCIGWIPIVKKKKEGI